jgi:hypothetical protein
MYPCRPMLANSSVNQSALGCLPHPKSSPGSVLDGCQCVYDGVTYYGGEKLQAPRTVAEFMVRSGWAVAESSSGPPESDSEPEAKAKAPARRQVSSGSGRRAPRR